jgi:nucleotidyltransferase/DNA polymerase involved in DNA repair
VIDVTDEVWEDIAKECDIITGNETHIPYFTWRGAGMLPIEWEEESRTWDDYALCTTRFLILSVFLTLIIYLDKAGLLAQKIREAVHHELHYTCSAGTLISNV